MAAYDYDMVFIGSGHATWHGAVALVAAGKRVALVEEEMAAESDEEWEEAKRVNARLIERLG